MQKINFYKDSIKKQIQEIIQENLKNSVIQENCHKAIKIILSLKSFIEKKIISRFYFILFCIKKVSLKLSSLNKKMSILYLNLLLIIFFSTTMSKTKQTHYVYVTFDARLNGL